MAVFTSTGGIVLPRQNFGSRNAHLLPEINTRVNRILPSARMETQVAMRVLNNTSELWTPIKSGLKCTCQKGRKNEELQESLRDGEAFSIEDFLLTGNMDMAINKEFCPLCFSTGILGGYRRSGVETLILEASQKPKVKDVTVLREKPWWIQAGPKWGTAIWTITLPRWFNDAIGIMLRWKNRPPSDFALELEGEPISLNLLKAYAGETVKITLRMRETGTDEEADDVGLIGIWLQLEIKESLVPIELPNIAESFTGDLGIYGEYNSPISINLDGTSGVISPNDILIAENGYIWRIIQVEQDTTLQINVDYNCEGRLVRNWESYYILPSKFALQKYPMKEWTFLN